MKLTDEQKNLAATISYLAARMMGADDVHGWFDAKVYNKGNTVVIATYCKDKVFKIKVTTEK